MKNEKNLGHLIENSEHNKYIQFQSNVILDLKISWVTSWKNWTRQYIWSFWIGSNSLIYQACRFHEVFSRPYTWRTCNNKNRFFFRTSVSSCYAYLKLFYDTSDGYVPILLDQFHDSVDIHIYWSSASGMVVVVVLDVVRNFRLRFVLATPPPNGTIQTHLT